MLRKLALSPLSEMFNGRHSKIKFEFALANFLSGVVASGFWPGCHGLDPTAPTFSRRMLQVPLAKSTSLLRSSGSELSSTVRASNDFSSVSFSFTRVSNDLSSDATLCADSSSVSNASLSSCPARMTSTSGITSKSPTINVPAITISLRCLDSQNLRRACSIMTALLFDTTRSIRQFELELEAEVGGVPVVTLPHAGAVQGGLIDVWHLFQIADEAVRAFVGIASTGERSGRTVADRHSIEPNVGRHALADMTEDLLPVGLR